MIISVLDNVDTCLRELSTETSNKFRFFVTGHANNQYETCFWMLVKSGKTISEAQEVLKVCC